MQNINTWFVLQVPTDQELRWSLQIGDRKMRRKRMMKKKRTTKTKTRSTQRVIITKRKRTKSMTFTSSFIK